jgi:hypothetical protein
MTDMKIDLDKKIPDLMDHGTPMKRTAPRIMCEFGHVAMAGTDEEWDVRYALIEALHARKDDDLKACRSRRRLMEKLADMKGEVTLVDAEMLLVEEAMKPWDRPSGIKGFVWGAFTESKKDEKGSK